MRFNMADQKITELTAGTVAPGDDLVAFVDDPGGTPITKKATLQSNAGAAAAPLCPDPSGDGYVPYVRVPGGREVGGSAGAEGPRGLGAVGPAPVGVVRVHQVADALGRMGRADLVPQLAQRRLVGIVGAPAGHQGHDGQGRGKEYRVSSHALTGSIGVIRFQGVSARSARASAPAGVSSSSVPT